MASLSGEDAIQESGIYLPLAIEGFTETTIEYVNWIVCQVAAPEEMILTLGQVHPPTITGATVEERKKQAEQIGFVSAKVVGKFSMTPARAEELVKALQENLDQYRGAISKGLK